MGNLADKCNIIIEYCMSCYQCLDTCVYEHIGKVGFIMCLVWAGEIGLNVLKSEWSSLLISE